LTRQRGAAQFDVTGVHFKIARQSEHVPSLLMLLMLLVLLGWLSRVASSRFLITNDPQTFPGPLPRM
jgi:hypothetical protein